MSSIFISPMDYTSMKDCIEVAFTIGDQQFSMWCAASSKDRIVQLAEELDAQYTTSQKKYSHLQDKYFAIIAALEAMNILKAQYVEENAILKQKLEDLEVRYEKLLQNSIKEVERFDNSDTQKEMLISSFASILESISRKL